MSCSVMLTLNQVQGSASMSIKVADARRWTLKQVQGDVWESFLRLQYGPAQGPAVALKFRDRAPVRGAHFDMGDAGAAGKRRLPRLRDQQFSFPPPLHEHD